MLGTVIYFLLCLLMDFVTGSILYLTATFFLHCFYDDSIQLTKKQICITLGGFLILPVMLIPFSMIVAFVFGFISGYFSELLQIDLSPSSDLFFTAIGYPIYAWLLTMISVRKGAGFKKTLRRFLTGMVFLFTIMAAADLAAEMLRYCFTATGLFGRQLMDYTSKDILIQQSVTNLLLGILLLFVYFRIYKKGVSLRLRKIDFISILLYNVIEVMMFILFKVIEKRDIALAGGSTELRIIVIGIMLLLLIITPVLIIRNRISASYQERNAYQESFLETELAASRQYKAAQEDTRAFRHDVQNNLTAIALLMEAGKTEEAKQYLNDMRTEVNALSPKIVTGDEMVDSLISAKLAKIEELGISFRTDGVIDGGLNWKPMDICTVFANLLDNAIEAAAKTEDGFILLEFRKSAHHRLIRASNRCAADVDCRALMTGGHITDKPDRTLHGYGIGNIRRTVEKYGGMMQISCADHVFTMEIILNK